ncbi:type II restriction endonuclease, partial [Flavobacterium davisii]
DIVNDELIITDEDGLPFTYNPKNKENQRLQETLFHEKQTIIENGLFGVDINPNSVKICRLRLWIELLKNAYYRNETELETLPNIDINIKCGNSLISRFGLDADLKEALKKSKLKIDDYKRAVDQYRNAESKEQKRDMETLIAEIKTNFRTEINQNGKEIKELQKLKYEFNVKFDSAQLFETKLTKAEQKAKKDLADKIDKIETQLEEIKSNKIYENAFEWRFEFPEVLNDEGDFVGFDVVIGNPPYVDAKKLAGISSLLKENYNVYYSSSDLSSYFFELGINVLKINGVFSFINTNKFFKTEYGKPLRAFISQFKINSIINFEQVPIFDEALVSSLIIVFEKNKNKSDFLFVEFD